MENVNEGQRKSILKPKEDALNVKNSEFNPTKTSSELNDDSKVVGYKKEGRKNKTKKQTKKTEVKIDRETNNAPGKLTFF